MVVVVLMNRGSCIRIAGVHCNEFCSDELITVPLDENVR